MKKRNLITVLVVLIVALHFASAGLVGSQNQVTTSDLSIEKAVSTQGLQESLNPDDVLADQDRSIYSKTTIISLLIAVIGIVAFRRNIYH